MTCPESDEEPKSFAKQLSYYHNWIYMLVKQYVIL